MALTLAQQQDAARQLAAVLFCGQEVNFAHLAAGTATINGADILAAVQAIDGAFDATLAQGVTAYGGTTTIINALAAVIPAPASGGTAQQKTILACIVLLKRAGLI